MPRHKGKVESSVKYVKSERPEGPRLHQSGGGESVSLGLGNERGGSADSRYDQAASSQTLRGGGTPRLAAVAGRAIPLLPRSSAGRASRRALGGGQGVLFRAAGIRGLSAVGALGRPDGPHLQRPLGAGGGACQGRTGPISHGRRAYPAKKSSPPWNAAPTPCLRQIAAIGPHTRQWAEATTQARGVEAVRVLVGLKHLAGMHDSEALEEACRVALTHGAYRLRSIRQLLKRHSAEQQQFELSRRTSDYSTPERLFARIFT